MSRPAQPINKLIKNFLKEVRTPIRKQQQTLARDWEELVGKRFAKHTRLAGIKQNILQVIPFHN